MIRCVVLVALIASTLHADERAVRPGGTGPNRLDPNVPFLAGAQALRYADAKTYTGGLDDLRLFDANRREVPYLVVPPARQRDEWIASHLLPIAATKTSSGFEADFGSIRLLDRIRLEGIPAPFLKRSKLEGSGDRSRWTLLAADATLFDLPDERLRNTEIAFEPGEYRYLRLTWDDRASAVVRHMNAVFARLHTAGTVPEPVRAAVPFRKLSSEPGKSRYRLQLPAAQIPVVAIEVEVTSGNVFRDATIHEPRLSGSEIISVALGSAKLRRAERAGAAAADLSIPIDFPSSADLDLVIDDGNNPPLAIGRIVARLAPLPWIYFESRDGAPLVASYGDPSRHAPRYDLEASRLLLGRLKPLRAEWGPAGSARPERAPEAGAPVMHGARVERSEFRHARPIERAQRGVARLTVDLDVLARSNNLADVRIVDQHDEQVPYLIEHLQEPLSIALSVPPRKANGAVSIYRLTLPYDSLPDGSKMVVTTTARVFERSVSLRRPADPSRGIDADVLWATSWRSAEPDLLPPPLTGEVPRAVRSIELIIDEGDNAPLPIASARLLVPATALRFDHPGTSLTLLYGNRRTAAPRYDLSLLASRFFAQPAHDIALASPPPTPVAESPIETRLFWIVIATAAIVLLAILARLLTSRAATSAS